MPLPKDNALRKALPLFTFLTEYFPDAILELVKVSVAGNMQHNPGEPMHWARGKSMDQLNTAMRHVWDHATIGVYDDEPPLPPEILAAIGGESPLHLAKAAWRLLAQIQLMCEERARVQEVVELFPDAYALTPDPLQPEERIVGMVPELAAPFGSEPNGDAGIPDEKPAAPFGAEPTVPVVPGRLALACGCKGYCKGGHPAESIQNGYRVLVPSPVPGKRLVPTGAGPCDPNGTPYASSRADELAPRAFDPAD